MQLNLIFRPTFKEVSNNDDHIMRLGGIHKFAMARVQNQSINRSKILK